MNKLIGAGALGVLGLFMLLGFFSSGASPLAPATLAAFLITVGLPLAGAGLLARSHYREIGRVGGRKALLRQQTLEAEVLRLAGEHGGRLTPTEVARDLAVPVDEAQALLKSLAVQDQADVQITDEGLIVYLFRDVRQLGTKSSAKGVLDA